MKDYLLLALATLAAALGGWAYVGHASAKYERAVSANLRTQVNGLADAVKESEAERKRIAKTSRELAARLKAQAAVIAEQKKALNESFKANPDWARAPVPDSVWDALGVRAPSGGATPPGPRLDGGGAGAAATRPDER